MKHIYLFTSILLFIVLSLTVSAQPRLVMPFNDNWHFDGGSVSGQRINKTVSLPHTWNATDAQQGLDYYRGDGIYKKTFVPDESWKNKRVFIRFNGVMTIADIYVNDDFMGEHRGGYSAFIFELTDKLKFGKENNITVVTNNEYTLEVLPLFGDFNIYGGIYRPVNIIVTSPVCISPLDYASPGIYLKQSNVSQSSAGVGINVKLSNATGADAARTIVATVYDADGNIINTFNDKINIKPGESEYSKNITIKNPVLWNGKTNPYLYSVTVEIKNGNIVTDSKTEPLGLRYFSIDPDSGFFLNGKHMPLHGVSRHQDRKDKGSAISYSDHKQDMDIMLEMGINALRLAHYQHSEIIYDLADSAGIVVWAEIPWVGGPAGFLGESNGYEPTEAFHNNAKQQLHELIRQNFNHPSICFWSIFNEIQNPEDESPVGFINELNDIAKMEDPSRLTVGASMLKPEENIHDITDAIAWNRYYGWYYDDPKDIGKFLDETHKKYPELCIGISEYGAGASINQHSQELKKPNPFGAPHPEEWQSYYHEEHLKEFNKRPFVWGTFLWNMFDFGSYFRREGDHYGINDKGLVTFDRKTKKDAFYFFKANWSSENVLHITSKRDVFRLKEKTGVKVYSNLKSVTLFVNGKKIGSRSPKDGIVLWENIVLKQGNNGIYVEGESNGKKLTDSCTWFLDTKFGTRQIAAIYDFMQYINIIIIFILILIVWLWYKGWRQKTTTKKWKRIVAKTLFFVFIILEIAVILFKLFVGSKMA